MMGLWTCLFLGGPVGGQYRTVQQGLAYKVVPVVPARMMTWDARWTYMAPPVEAEEPQLYTPVRFRFPGWRVLVWVYLHSSMMAGAPVIPTGTVLPGSVHLRGAEYEPVCVVCYRRPIPGYPFCTGRTAGVSHARVAAELHLLERL